MTEKTAGEAGSEEINAGHLRSFVERIERLEGEKRDLAEDIKAVFTEAKGSGFDPKILRKLIAIRRQDPSDRSEEEILLDLYLAALAAP